MKKGTKMSLESRKKMSLIRLGKKLSLETRRRMSENSAHNRYWLGKHTGSGEKNGMWKGDKVSYWGIHKWLVKQFGNANKCERKQCYKRNFIYQWALRKGKNYERKRENFIQLCKSCHSIYDRMIKNING